MTGFVAAPKVDMINDFVYRLSVTKTRGNIDNVVKRGTSPIVGIPTAGGDQRYWYMYTGTV